MTTQTADLTIELGRTTDPNGLFASEADMSGVDVQASMDRFNEIMEREVSARYPDAEVTTTDGTRAYGFEDEGDVLQMIAAIADEVIQGDEWIVTDQMGCDRCGDMSFADDQLVEQANGQRICGACEFAQAQP